MCTWLGAATPHRENTTHVWLSAVTSADRLSHIDDNYTGHTTVLYNHQLLNTILKVGVERRLFDLFGRNHNGLWDV